MAHFHYTNLFSTYSIIARDPESGQLGGAVQTHQMAVGRLIPYALPGVGVVASQSLVNISYNPQALTMLREGIAPQRIIDALVASDNNAHRRQVAVINHKGEAAAFSGEGCIAEFGHHVGENYSVQANMMTYKTVIPAMRTAFESATGDLAARMLAALEAAQNEDGDIRGTQSAALKVVSGERTVRDWETIYDLRVDEHTNPVGELGRLVQMRHAQLIDSEGHRLLAEAKTDEALEQWQRARNLTPQQEEIAFWQAVTLADTRPVPNAVEIAASIFNNSFRGDERRLHWLDLIHRLSACGLIHRDNAASELLSAIERGSA
jgi:uncharacterized Ntn-hydrolase superfamily protein